MDEFTLTSYRLYSLEAVYLVDASHLGKSAGLACLIWVFRRSIKSKIRQVLQITVSIKSNKRL